MDPKSIEMQVGQILAQALKAGASDIHLRSDQAPMFRINGELQPTNLPPLERSTMRFIAERMTPAGLRDEAATANQIDFSAEWQGASRFRVHRFLVRGEPALVLRIIPLKVPDFAALRLPVAVKRIAMLDRGLVLVTGATGMGKSTTIASVLDYVANQSRKHILTIEDPIEFIIESSSSLISQREVGRDVADFNTGLWSALREDPDVICIGEIRDVDTLRVALQASETGHLVISAIHTADVCSTIEHVVNMFPPQEQLATRLRLADVLQVVVCQLLVPMKGRKQRVLATEVMLRTPSIQECIRRPDRNRPLLEKIAQSNSEAMHSFDQDLRRLYEAGMIDMDVASAAASSPSEFVRNMQVM